MAPFLAPGVRQPASPVSPRVRDSNVALRPADRLDTDWRAGRWTGLFPAPLEPDGLHHLARDFGLGVFDRPSRHVSHVQERIASSELLPETVLVAHYESPAIAPARRLDAADTLDQVMAESQSKDGPTLTEENVDSLFPEVETAVAEGLAD